MGRIVRMNSLCVHCTLHAALMSLFFTANRLVVVVVLVLPGCGVVVGVWVIIRLSHLINHFICTGSL